MTVLRHDIQRKIMKNSRAKGDGNRATMMRLGGFRLIDDRVISILENFHLVCFRFSLGSRRQDNFCRHLRKIIEALPQRTYRCRRHLHNKCRRPLDFPDAQRTTHRRASLTNIYLFRHNFSFVQLNFQEKCLAHRPNINLSC